MNFYEYYAGGDTTTERISLAAAQSLIENGFQVVPIKKGQKQPADTIKNLMELRQKPLNVHNVGFYFDRDDVEIAIMLRRDMEVLDIDSKNKQGLSESFISAIRYGDPDLYDRLVISKTPSGGLHILYRSEVIGGEISLARVNASPNPLTIIERINESNKNFIKCAPSSGYEFIQGNPIELPFLTAEERTWLSGVAASFNELIIPETSKVEAERTDSPWFVFNEGHGWQWILDELKDRGWQEVTDRQDKVVLRRPGQTNQHSAYLWKENNSLYVFSSSSDFEPEKGYTAFGVYALLYHDKNVAAACRKLASEGIGKNIHDEGNFWKRNGRKIIIKYTELSIWLKQVGYRLYKGQIVKITDNTVSIIDDRKLKAAFLNEVEYDMQDHFFDKVSTIFSDNGGIMALMDEIEDRFIKDDKESIWLFFKNYVVKITSVEVLTYQYKEVDGYIWESSILDRSFHHGTFAGCDAERFASILGGKKVEDLRKLLGYSISRYKDPVNPRAVILTEDISADHEGESQGGSGKGLLFAFIRQFRKVCDFDGKSFKPTDNFAFQNVEADTNIMFIDDLDKHFKFTSMFSILTGALPVNKKNEKQILIPFDVAPKVFITSNYSVGDIDISSQRRKLEFAVVKHFGEEIEPIDEFKREFFTGWDAVEWGRFDNFIADCCRLYLADNNKKNIGNITENSKERQLITATDPAFVSYMDDQLSMNFFDFAPIELKNRRGYIGDTLYTNFVNYDAALSQDTKPSNYLLFEKESFSEKMRALTNKKHIKTTTVTQWINKWMHARGVKIDVGYKRPSDNARCYRVVEFVPTLLLSESEYLSKKSEKLEIPTFGVNFDSPEAPF